MCIRGPSTLLEWTEVCGHAGMVHLQHLNISGHQGLTSQGLQALAGMTALTYLNLAGTSQASCLLAALGCAACVCYMAAAMMTGCAWDAFALQHLLSLQTGHS